MSHSAVQTQTSLTISLIHLHVKASSIIIKPILKPRRIARSWPPSSIVPVQSVVVPIHPIVRMVPATMSTANIHTVSISLHYPMSIHFPSSLLSHCRIVSASVARITFGAPAFFMTKLLRSPRVAPVRTHLPDLICHDQFAICQNIRAFLHEQATHQSLVILRNQIFLSQIDCIDQICPVVTGLVAVGLTYCNTLNCL